MSEDATTVHDPDHQRYLVHFAGGGTGIATYRRRGDVLDITHTSVPEDRRGQGLGAVLMAGVMRAIEADGLRVRPLCSFAVAYLQRHRELHHLLEEPT